MRKWIGTMCVVGACLAGPGVADGAIGTPQNGLVAFAQESGSIGPQLVWAIWVTDPNGTAPPTQISPSTIFAVNDMSFASDGFHVAYALGSGAQGTAVWVTDLSGQNAHMLVSQGYSPSWLPDGQHLVFTDGRSVKLTDLQGNVTTEFTPLPPSGEAGTISEVAVSPNGQQVALTMETDPGTDPSAAHYEIFLANIDGSNLHQLTTTGGGGATRAEWAPNGARLVFYGGPTPRSIYSISPGGGTPTVLKAGYVGTDPTGWATPIAYLNPMYSPDGTQIVYSKDFINDDSFYGPLTEPTERMTADGSGETQIKTATGYEPTWGPLPSCAVIAEYPTEFAGAEASGCVSATAGS
jgi:Tol biopolymer transport system component